MKVDIIHSGSSGNMAIIDDKIIIDAGYPPHPTHGGEVVFLTHHHTDHTKHIEKFSGLPMFATFAAASELKRSHPYLYFGDIRAGTTIPFDGEYAVQPWELVHDAPCVGFDITKRGTDKRIFFATDFNKIVDEEKFIYLLRAGVFSALYIECNNTLTPLDIFDVHFPTEAKEPRDAYHRVKSYRNHCNASYLLYLFERAGYHEENRFTAPVTLLHKSSYYYAHNPEQIVRLSRIANIINPA